MQWISFERLLNYLNLKSERKGEIPYKDVMSWPATGKIRFNNFSTRYREGLDEVISDLDLKIKDGEKIGVCGRTGAGKSTIILSILRVLEAT